MNFDTRFCCKFNTSLYNERNGMIICGMYIAPTRYIVEDLSLLFIELILMVMVEDSSVD